MSAKSWLSTILVLNGILGLMCVPFLGFDANPWSYEFGVGLVALSCVDIWIGTGLGSRQPVARWLALGICLWMIIGAILSPFLIIMVIGASAVLGALSHGRFDGSGMFGYKLVAVGLLAWTIFCGVIGYRALKYLRSFEGRMEFVKDPQAARTGVLPHESAWMVIASAAVGLVMGWASTYQLSIRRDSLPRFLMTKEMRAAEHREHEYDVKKLASLIRFTADSRHLVVAPSKLQGGWVVIDLVSGKAQRSDVKRTFSDREIGAGIAPDGSSIVHAYDWVSLKMDDEEKIKSLEGVAQIGFYSPTKFLVYRYKGGTLELIDLEKDKVLYSIEVPQGQRGDSSSFGWGQYSQGWSKDRSRYVWMTRDKSIAILDVAEGTVLTASCPHCMYGQFIDFTPKGDAIFVPDPGGRSNEEMSTALGAVYDIHTGSWRDIQYHGQSLFLAEGGEYVASWDYGKHQLFYSEIDSNPVREWTLHFDSAVAGARSSDGRTIRTYTDGRGSQFTGEFVPPTRAEKFELAAVTPTLADAQQTSESADGRFVLYMAGARIEVIDLEATARGDPASRAMDVLEDDELTKVAAAPAARPLEAHWEEEVPPDELVDAAATGDSYDAAVANALGQQGEAQREPPPPVTPAAATVRTEPAAPGSILKCVDRAGTVTFTQVTCPPGTTPKDAPPIDVAPSQPYGARTSSSRISSNVIANAQQVPQPLKSLVRFGDRVTSSPMESIPCPGNPYAIRKPDGGTQQLEIHTGVYKHVITRENGTTETLFVAGFPEQKVFQSRNQAVEGSCATSVQDAARRIGSGANY